MAFLRDEAFTNGDRDTSAEITALTKQLEHLNQIQDAARAELTKVTAEIAKTEQELAVRSMSARHYDKLASVYVGVSEWIDRFYDRRRSHSSPGMLSPFADELLRQHAAI